MIATLASVSLASPSAEPVGGIAGWAVDVMSTLGAVGSGLTNLVDTVLPFIPSEIILPVAGFAAGQGKLSLPAVILWTTIGSIVGSWIVYAVGALLGRERTRALAARIPLLSAHEIDKADAWFERHGRKAVFIARMVPVVRSLISVPAGIQRMPLLPFTVMTAAGSLIWNTLFVLLGYWLGDNWQLVEEYGGWVSKGVVVVGVLVVGRWFLVRMRRRPSARHRG
ncbi:DedA family protein [Streptomyces sp. 1331.2]|uniref:DedA family protein n=1 Tax=Streptomyces sp. 1331.2 TaxID=1938835 RepID=UPI000BDACF18|nr:DedA family protein [Streptomyces sp. 1331.2]SOB81265.1 membrane protein DedA, SNARE-associated domain [Streptomyces sp. 1331.2]